MDEKVEGEEYVCVGEGKEGCVLEREQVCVVTMAVSYSGGVSSSSCKLVNARWSGGGGA